MNFSYLGLSVYGHHSVSAIYTTNIYYQYLLVSQSSEEGLLRERKSGKTGASEQPSSSAKHTLQGLGTNPLRQSNPPQVGLMHKDSLPRAVLSVVFSRAVCTNNAKVKQKNPCYHSADVSRILFP